MEDEGENIEMNTSSARRAYTLRNNVARQVAVNFMPSRQIAHNTLRMRRVNSEHNALLDALTDAPDAVEQQADIIVREMEQHQLLMEDNPMSEELRREALRDLPQCMTMKRNVRAKLSASVSLRSKRRPISFFKRLKYRVSFAWKRTRDKFRDFIFSIELWYEAIRNIEGHLGSAVGSYFHLLRWLFGLNLLLSALLISFVVVPQALHDQAGNSTNELGVLDFISGRGGLEHTLLFYGHYHDSEIDTPGPVHYYMPFAYFYTMLCLYLMFFAVLCYRTAYSYRRNFIEPSGGHSAFSHLLAAKLFCGWDFGIASPAGAALAAHALYLEFKELLNERNRNQMATSVWVRAWQRMANVLVTMLVLAIIVGIQYGLWLLLAVEELTDNREIYISLAITAVVGVCPMLLSFIVKLEYYEARTAFYVTLARTWLLDIGTLVILLVYWSRSGDECWETRVGQEGYRLVILDVLVSLLLIPSVEFVRGMLFKWSVLGKAPAFDITYNSLTLIYNQSVLWLGMLFSPLLVVAVTLKFLLLFYVKRESALRMCQTSKKVWRAAQTQTVLYMLVTLSLFTTLFAVGSLFLRSSSQTCGPFRRYEHVFAIVSEGLLRLSERDALRAVLHFFVRPGPIAFVLLGLCVGVYIMRARSAAQRSMAGILRQMLRLQAKDKDFLLSAIEKVSNGEWLYSPKPEDYGADSHTWKYLNEVRKPSNAGFHFDGSRLSHSFLERPKSYVKETRPTSYHTERPKSHEDGDTDSSFSWQGSSSYLNQKDDAEEKR
ncbi:transmembrane channel-like protein 3 [Pararge aegeria]|uniref:transmembrane channel-like protein 3 n=1 Tax=Pararge aegeria TaxID=116150 RepID=UPI0019CFD382|nr:transmembrane channel-like protein 3 [Pararge aegeria]